MNIYINTTKENGVIIKTAQSDSELIPRIYLKFPEKVEADLTELNDSFVHLLLFPMMIMGGGISI